MGAYITQSDLYTQFGQGLVDKWADLPTAGEATATDRITAAIAYAEGEVENAFVGSPYEVPFTLAASDLGVIKAWMCVYAADWLRRARPVDTDKKDHVGELLKQVKKDINLTLAGMRRFRTGEYDTTTPTSPTAVDS